MIIFSVNLVRFIYVHLKTVIFKLAICVYVLKNNKKTESVNKIHIQISIVSNKFFKNIYSV